MPAWTPEKVDLFRESFYSFLKVVRINSKEKGPICLGDNIYRAQTRFWECVFDGLSRDIHDFKHLKSRQLGISTGSRALTVFWCGIHEGLRGYMVFDTESHKEEARLELLEMINGLPADYNFPRIKYNNRYLIELENGTRINLAAAGARVSKTTNTLGRSSGINFVHCSEVCSWGDWEAVEAFKAALAQDFENRLYIWESPLALETPVPVPNGWKTIGEIKEGDDVYDERGIICSVVGLSPVFINRRCYKITFSNGETIIADEQHRWSVMERRWPTNPQWKPRIVTTSQLDPENQRIEVSCPLDMPDIELPIDPYLLGAWLGDGKASTAEICAGDEDIDEMRELLSERGCHLGKIQKYDWRVGAFTIHGQRAAFAKLGLLRNKHIPAIYLRASERQRRELLAGLMDTDGHISETNFRCEFANSSPRLVNDMAELLASLGIKFSRSVFSVEGKMRMFPSGREYACAEAERLRFCEHPKLKVFNLSRKKKVQNQQRGYTHRKAKYLKIVSIDEATSVPVKCIAVSNPTHLFLVGKTMIPTHNTGKGYNLWRDIWLEAKDDFDHQCTLFTGWWGKDNQVIRRVDPDFEKYGVQPPTDDELRKIAIVKQDYDWEVSPEQLAWVRRYMNPGAKPEGDAPIEFDGSTSRIQEVPWHEEEAFQATGFVYFSPEKLTDQVNKNVSKKYKTWKYEPGLEFHELRVYPAPNSRMVELKVWEEPVDGAIYGLAIDPAFGHSETSDRSAIQIVRYFADGMDQVAEYAWPLITTNHLAWVAASLAAWYGGRDSDVYMIIEINGPGDAVLTEMRQLRHRLESGYLPKEAEEAGLRNIFQNVRNYFYWRSDSLGPGRSLHWKTTGNNKIGLMERLRDFISNGMLRVRSMATVEEMMSVSREGDKIESQGRKKDDRVIALALAVRMWEDRVRRPMVTQRRTREAEEAKRRLSPTDRVKMFADYQIDQMMQRKQTIRRREVQMGRRMQWRYGR